MQKYKITALLTIAIISAFFISACGTATETVEEETEKVVEKTEKKPEIKTDKAEKGLAVGTESPEFELATMDGGKFSSETIKGKPAVLVFWSAYCGKCKKETPEINTLAKEFTPKGVEVIGINTGESEKEIKEGIESFGIKYPVAADDGKAVMEKFGAVGTPTIVFLDKEGKINYYGNKLPEDYSERLDSMS